MSAYFVLSPVPSGLLLCLRLVPDPTNKAGNHKSISALHIVFHEVEEVQRSWPSSQGQDFQMMLELTEDHTKL